mmetsp:Transcript_10594/g.31864  ORF Transcript_10594/g.31864 Transcript_10594/m.31864 type:complete len:287 (-) Transcript_10594:9-869(-)
MGGLVSSLAFPVPRLPFSFYSEGLLRRDDVVWLYTCNKEKIPAVHVKPPRNPRSPAAGEGLTILYSHGNAEDVGLHLPFIDALARATGCDVLSYEYVGYSLSRFANCQPDEEGCYRSIDAAWVYLTETLGVPAHDVVVFGRSIGTGPSVDLVARDGLRSGRPAARSPRGARGLLLQSPIDSAIRCALGYGSSLTMYPLDIFVNYEKMPQVRCPTAIIHGLSDTIVPDRCGKALHKLAPNPFEACWLEGYGHNDMPYDPLFMYAISFLAKLKRDPPAYADSSRGVNV